MVAVCNWLSVPLVAVFGAKWSMVVSAALYVIYIAAIIRPYVPMVFLGAFILGSAGGGEREGGREGGGGGEVVACSKVVV